MSTGEADTGHSGGTLQKLKQFVGENVRIGTHVLDQVARIDGQMRMGRYKDCQESGPKHTAGYEYIIT